MFPFYTPTTISKMECFVIIGNGFQPLTIITKPSILDVAAALGPPLVNSIGLILFWVENRKLNIIQTFRYFVFWLFQGVEKWNIVLNWANKKYMIQEHDLRANQDWFPQVV